MIAPFSLSQHSQWDVELACLSRTGWNCLEWCKAFLQRYRWSNPHWWFNLHPSCSGTGEEDDWKNPIVMVNPNEVVGLGAAVQVRPFLLLKPWHHPPFHYYWRRKYQLNYSSLVIRDLFSTVFLFIRMLKPCIFFVQDIQA